MNKPSVAAIVVTHNRLSLLKENIGALRHQTWKPDEIIVINNNSKDGTAEWLAAQPDLTVMPQGEIGPSGAAFVGIKAAYARGHDWFWCMDDDAIPDSDALEQLLKSPKADDERTGFLCSYIRWTDGSICWGGVPTVHPDYASLIELFPQGLLRLSSATFLSILFHRRAVAKKGLPLREMFLWYFDDEYTNRISDDFLCYQVLASKAEHRNKVNRWLDFNNMVGLQIEYLQVGLRNFVFLRERDAPPGCAKLWRLKSAMRLQLLVWRQFSGANWRKLAWAICCGLFFNPKIEMPESQK
ncbi:MAG TPA: glycosyltransferase [Verrucomicrobiae bacterium]|nr:glycosyltransferase [Verrucomicrobiae bacterium]